MIGSIHSFMRLSVLARIVDGVKRKLLIELGAYSEREAAFRWRTRRDEMLELISAARNYNHSDSHLGLTHQGHAAPDGSAVQVPLVRRPSKARAPLGPQ